jgi:hypothetical protein
MGNPGPNLVAPVESPPEYAKPVDEFLELDKQCQELIEKFTSGRILYECVPVEPMPDPASFMNKMIEKFNSFQTYMKELIDLRNSKLQDIQNALRAAVTATVVTRKGPDGKATVISYGPFKVNSRTVRTFDPATLFGKVQELGLYTKLLELKMIDKNTGEQIPAIRQEWEISYEPVKNMLREMNLENIISEAYREKEETPAVTGPKPISFIGEVQKKK